MSAARATDRRRAAELVGKGATRKEAARAVGVSERTVREWLKRPELDAVVQQVRKDTLDPTVTVSAGRSRRLSGGSKSLIALPALQSTHSGSVQRLARPIKFA